MRLMTLVHYTVDRTKQFFVTHTMMDALQLVMQFGRKKKKYRVSLNSARNGSTKVPFAAIACIGLLVWVSGPNWALITDNFVRKPQSGSLNRLRGWNENASGSECVWFLCSESYGHKRKIIRKVVRDKCCRVVVYFISVWGSFWTELFLYDFNNRQSNESKTYKKISLVGAKFDRRDLAVILSLDRHCVMLVPQAWERKLPVKSCSSKSQSSKLTMACYAWLQEKKAAISLHFIAR